MQRSKEKICRSKEKICLNISQLHIRHKWQSILQYDRVFRIHQASSQCGWGEDISHLENAYLEKKTPPPEKQNQGQINRNKTRNELSSTNNELKNENKIKCHQFDLGIECIFTPCRYRHACELCDGEHPLIDGTCPKFGGGKSA